MQHTETDMDNKNAEEQYKNQIAKEDRNYERTLEEYMDPDNEANLVEIEQLDDIYFLD